MLRGSSATTNKQAASGMAAPKWLFATTQPALLLFNYLSRFTLIIQHIFSLELQRFMKAAEVGVNESNLWWYESF